MAEAHCIEAAVKERQPLGLCPKPRDFWRHGSGVRSVKEKPLTGFAVRGMVLDRRTVDLVIPCRVASPQSPTPFHQTGVSVARDRKYENETLQ